MFDATEPPFKAERKSQDRRAAQLRTPGARDAGRVQRFPVPILQGRSQVLRGTSEATPRCAALTSRTFRSKLHPWAKPAAIAGRCVFQQNPAAFWDYHDWIYRASGRNHGGEPECEGAGLGRGQKDVDAAKLGRCIDTRRPRRKWTQNMAEGRVLGVNCHSDYVHQRPPADRCIRGRLLEQVIEVELEYARRPPRMRREVLRSHDSIAR